jgi:hypothetical protein
MKPVFPVLYAKASTIVATPLIGLVAFFYVARAITQPASDVYGIGMAAFGVTAGLSAICFSVPETVPGSSNFRYAVVMLTYLKDCLACADWLSNPIWLGLVVRRIPLFLLPLLSGAAAVTWHLGFGVADAQLWQNWKQRIEDVNRAATASEKAKTRDAKSAS